MSFTEILLILVIAVIFVGPDKLPKVAVDIAKIFRRFKGAVNDAKSAIDDELNVTELKQEAQKYKAQIEQTTTKARVGLDEMANLDLGMDNILDDDEVEDRNEDDDIANKKEKKKKKKNREIKKEKLAYVDENVKDKIENNTDTNKEEA